MAQRRLPSPSRTGVITAAALHFDAPLDELLPRLVHDPDSIEFGVIGMDSQTRVEVYNRFEAQASGLSPERVIGRPFFDEIGLCMNNYLVAQRFLDEPALDEQLDYVLTLRMRPTRVRLRLVKRAGEARQWVLLRWEAR